MCRYIKSKKDKFLQILIISVKISHQALWGISGESPEATSIIVDHLLRASVIRVRSLLTYPNQIIYYTLPCHPVQQEM